MSEIWIVIFALAASTLTIRLAGIALGQQIPRSGPWARALNALPGCLIVSLVTVSLLSGGLKEWLAGGVAACIAIVSRNLLLTMAGGIAAVWLLRTLM